MRKLSLGLFVAFSIVNTLALPSLAQITNAGMGSTPQGDMARGAGVYLQGLGWYELNDAKAAAQNADTMIRLEKWNREVQLAYRREYNAAVEQKNYRTKKAYEVAQRKHAEREQRLRTSPTPEDIAKGDALNALLADLSDPTIQESSWRGAKVPLPGDISIKSLAFRFAPKGSAKENAALTRGLIALGRLDTAGRWPDVFPMDKLKAEIPAYEASYGKIRDQSLAGRIDLASIGELDRSLNTLEASVGKVVPPDRGFRAAALQYVRDLKASTKMFDATTLDFAREMIADTNKHEAHTVGELLAFMRKYRLLFAKADSAPGGEEMYARLYGLLRQQEEALGIKSSEGLAGPMVPADAVIFGDKSYKVFTDKISWLDAKERCREIGGHLAIVRNENENRFINTLVRNNGLNLAWLGATDAEREGSWIWIDGSKMVFSKWDVDQQQPNNKGRQGVEENHLMMKVDRGGLWWDMEPDGFPGWDPGYVCQWDNPSRKPSSPIDLEYQKVTGTWRIESQNAEGRDVVMANYLGQIRLTIDRERYTASKGAEIVEAGFRKLDPTKIPKQIDVFINEGKSKGKSFLGIYEWDGDRMRLCQGLPGFPRPTEFKAGPGRLLSIYVRTD